MIRSKVKPMQRDIIDDLKFVPQTHRPLHEARIGREFQMTVTILAFFAACVVARYELPEESVIFLSCFSPYDVCILLAFAGLVVIATLNLIGSMQANRMNQKLAERAEDIILQDLKVKGVDLPTPIGHPNKARWLWQLIIIVAGALIAAILIIVPL